MAGSRLESPINPQVLVWARESLNMPLHIAAKKMGVKEESLFAWESGQEKPSFPQLLKIGECYKRSPGVFFLPQAPVEPPPPKDFRVFDEGAPSQLSADSLIEIRRVISRREEALEISRMLGEEVSEFKFSTTLEADHEKLAQIWRAKLGITAELQDAWKSEYEAFNYWRSAMEAIDILVFQAQVNRLDEFRGIAIFNKVLPIIVLNTKDSPRGKIFSMLHELCHLLLHVSGIGNMEPPHGKSDRINRIEVFCNAFAGACLVPAAGFLKEAEVRSIAAKEAGALSMKNLGRLVKRYEASWEVVLRRLYDLSVISLRQYRTTRDEIAAHFASLPKKDDGGFADWNVMKFSQAGSKFTSLILRGASAGVITKSDVSSILGVKLNHLHKIEDMLSRKRK